MKKGDILYEQAKYEIIGTGKASSSYLQRRMGISYNKAVDIIDRLEKDCIIGKAKGVKSRKVLIAPINGRSDEYLEYMGSEYEKLYKKAKKILKEDKKITSSILMKNLVIGYAHSAILLDMLKARNVIDKSGKKLKGLLLKNL